MAGNDETSSPRILFYGEWPRRERRRADPRDQLRLAHQIFPDLGMEGVRRTQQARAGRDRPDR